MRITVNGEAKELSANTTVKDLLQLMDLVNRRLAVEINLEILPRSRYDEYRFQENDRVEIVHAIGGG
ncbi:MAG: sulfur carrier protein ThiS [Gammaproteobacteria bacterium]|nr:sulfur carrier protein ThiS [Gammaproteobacteria bacterium]